MYNIIVMYGCDKGVIVNFKDSMLFLKRVVANERKWTVNLIKLK